MLIWYPLESTTGKFCTLTFLMKNCCLKFTLIDDVCHYQCCVLYWHSHESNLKSKRLGLQLLESLTYALR